MAYISEENRKGIFGHSAAIAIPLDNYMAVPSLENIVDSSKGTASKVAEFAKGIAKNIPVYGSLRTNEKAIAAAMSHVGGMSQNRKIDGSTLWEVMHQDGINNIKTKGAFMDALADNNYTINGEVKSAHEIKNVSGIGGKLQRGLNNVLDATGISNIVGNLEVYRGDNSWDTYSRNFGSKAISGEVRAAVSAAALAGFGPSLYYALGTAAGGLDEATKSHHASGAYGAILGTIGLASAIAAGRIDQALRSGAMVGTQVAGRLAQGKKDSFSEKVAEILGLGMTASSLGFAYGGLSHADLATGMTEAYDSLKSAYVSHSPIAHVGASVGLTDIGRDVGLSMCYNLAGAVKAVEPLAQWGVSELASIIEHPYDSVAHCGSSIIKSIENRIGNTYDSVAQWGHSKVGSIENRIGNTWIGRTYDSVMHGSAQPSTQETAVATSEHKLATPEAGIASQEHISSAAPVPPTGEAHSSVSYHAAAAGIAATIEPLWKMLDGNPNGVDINHLKSSMSPDDLQRYSHLFDFDFKGKVNGFRYDGNHDGKIDANEARAFLDDHVNTYLHNYHNGQRVKHIGEADFNFEDSHKFHVKFNDNANNTLDALKKDPTVGYRLNESDLAVRVFDPHSGKPIAVYRIGANGFSDEITNTKILEGIENHRYVAEASFIDRQGSHDGPKGPGPHSYCPSQFGDDRVHIFGRINDWEHGHGHGHRQSVTSEPDEPTPQHPSPHERDLSIRYHNNNGKLGRGGIHNPAAFEDPNRAMYPIEGHIIRPVVPEGDNHVTKVLESDGKHATYGRESFWNFLRPEHREVYVEGKRIGGLSIEQGHAHHNSSEPIVLQDEQGVKFKYHAHQHRYDENGQPARWYQKHTESEPIGIDSNRHILDTDHYSNGKYVGSARQELDVRANLWKYRAEGAAAALPIAYGLSQITAAANIVKEAPVVIIEGFKGGIGGTPGIVGTPAITPP